MRRSNPEPLGNILNDFFSSNDALRQRILVMRVQRAWGELLGPSVMKYTGSVYVRNRALYVSLTSSVLRSELMLNREELIRRLNNHAGGEVIVDIVMR
ncbi:MAG: DUF721 domain-containing protein [Tannerellaceae bacterium]|jgi:hypothetical protein|nr:DUF721 domain-containing protein [Tannerellaceae bacterium]